jgi:hypothetical protein
MVMDFIDRHVLALSGLQISDQRVPVFRFILHSAFYGHTFSSLNMPAFFHSRPAYGFVQT